MWSFPTAVGLTGLLVLRTRVHANEEVSQPMLRRNLEAAPIIPHNIWFTYKENLLETKDPRNLFDNVMATINSYQTLWDDPMAPAALADDERCIEEISNVVPDLVPYFEYEMNGAFKGDICRTALLYHYGGYYFDVDMEVIQPYIPPETVTFVSATSCDGDCFFQSFMASAPEHPILQLALENMIRVYDFNTQKHMLGPYTIAQAYFNLPEAELKTVHLLKEDRLDVQTDENPVPQLYPDVERQHGIGNCNYVVHDPKAGVLYFWARFLGTPACKQIIEKKKPKIPQMLWFTHEINILVEKEPQNVYKNVENTIRRYREAWSEPWAPVSFMDNERCLKKIKAVSPDLATYFESEGVGAYKADICRAAAVFLHGGYYFDVDIEVVEPYIPADDTDFVSTLSCGGKCFFQAFFAATPQNPILQGALRKMIQIYQNGEDNAMIGPITMASAFHEISDTEETNVRLLEDLRLDVGPNPVHYPNLARQQGVGNCNYIIHDKKQQKVYFYARFVGYGSCQEGSNEEE